MAEDWWSGMGAEKGKTLNLKHKNKIARQKEIMVTMTTGGCGHCYQCDDNMHARIHSHQTMPIFKVATKNTINCVKCSSLFYLLIIIKNIYSCSVWMVFGVVFATIQREKWLQWLICIVRGGSVYTKAIHFQSVRRLVCKWNSHADDLPSNRLCSSAMSVSVNSPLHIYSL